MLENVLHSKSVYFIHVNQPLDGCAQQSTLVPKGQLPGKDGGTHKSEEPQDVYWKM